MPHLFSIYRNWRQRRFLYRIITSLKIVEDIVGRPFVVTDFGIQMINSNFKFNVPIDLTKLVTVIPIPFVYNKDDHHAVRIKLDGVCIMVFMSGSVIMTGAKSAGQLFESFKFLIDIVDRHYELLKMESYMPRKRSVVTEPRSAKRMRLSLA